jgi:hypothetical protein
MMTRDEALAILDLVDDPASVRVDAYDANLIDSLLKQSDRPGWTPSDRQQTQLLRLKREAERQIERRRGR